MKDPCKRLEVGALDQFGFFVDSARCLLSPAKKAASAPLFPFVANQSIVSTNLQPRLEFYGPLLVAVKNRNQLQAFAPNPVRNDVGGVWRDELASSYNPTRPAHFGLCLKWFD